MVGITGGTYLSTCTNPGPKPQRRPSAAELANHQARISGHAQLHVRDLEPNEHPTQFLALSRVNRRLNTLATPFFHRAVVLVDILQTVAPQYDLAYDTVHQTGHPNIVNIHDAAMRNRLPFVTDAFDAGGPSYYLAKHPGSTVEPPNVCPPRDQVVHQL